MVIVTLHVLGITYTFFIQFFTHIYETRVMGYDQKVDLQKMLYKQLYLSNYHIELMVP
uniref:Uncharacterized protein n=1 Tax=Anguilla anguilla TaxID=7936 RepID=A0A0E9Q5S1_ANGAN